MNDISMDYVDQFLAIFVGDVGAVCDGTYEFTLNELRSCIESIAQEHEKALRQVEILQRQVSLDLAKMLTMADGLRIALEASNWAQGTSNYNALMREVKQALDQTPNLLFSGPAELSNGMLCGYLGEKDRIDAPDQIVMVHVVGTKEKDGERDS